MAELANCPVCQNLFLKNHLSNSCESCYKKEEQRFQQVRQFLKKRENELATNEDVAAETGVELKELHQFMKNGRLRIMAYPNLGYPCERCEELIRKDRLCTGCIVELEADLKMHEWDQRLLKER